MNSIKNVFTPFAFILLMTITHNLSANNLNNLSAESNPKNWKEKIVNYLSDFEELGKTVPDKVLVKFILNDNKEIMVLSTSHSELDGWLKSKLNFTIVDTQELEAFEKYTLPIVFNKE